MPALRAFGYDMPPETSISCATDGEWTAPSWSTRLPVTGSLAGTVENSPGLDCVDRRRARLDTPPGRRGAVLKHSRRRAGCASLVRTPSGRCRRPRGHGHAKRAGQRTPSPGHGRRHARGLRCNRGRRGVGAIVVTGARPASAPVPTFPPRSSRETAFVDLRDFLRLSRCPLPSGRGPGAAVGGAQHALSCDGQPAGESARFAHPSTNRHPPAGGYTWGSAACGGTSGHGDGVVGEVLDARGRAGRLVWRCVATTNCSRPPSRGAAKARPHRENGPTGKDPSPTWPTSTINARCERSSKKLWSMDQPFAERLRSRLESR